MSTNKNPLIIGAIGAALLVGGGWAGWHYFTLLPDCSNEETVRLLKKIVRIEIAGTDDPTLLEHFDQFVKVDVNAIETLSFTKDPARYTCEAEVKVDLGDAPQLALGVTQEMLNNPNILTSIIVGPRLQEIYGPLENLRAKFTSTWAKDQGQTRHYVTVRLSNPEATGYASLTQVAWTNMKEKQSTQKKTATPNTMPVQSAPQPAAEPAKNDARPTPSQAPVSVETEALKISNNWMKAMSQAQAGDEISALYESQVDFYGKSGVSREAIAREKTGFIKRWPQRLYKPMGNPVILKQSPESITWSQNFSFAVSDGIKSTNGQSKLTFTARSLDGEWLIVAENKSTQE